MSRLKKNANEEITNKELLSQKVDNQIEKLKLIKDYIKDNNLDDAMDVSMDLDVDSIFNIIMDMKDERDGTWD